MDLLLVNSVMGVLVWYHHPKLPFSNHYLGNHKISLALVQHLKRTKKDQQRTVTMDYFNLQIMALDNLKVSIKITHKIKHVGTNQWIYPTVQKILIKECTQRNALTVKVAMKILKKRDRNRNIQRHKNTLFHVLINIRKWMHYVT